jgi:hypothetical protein
VDVKMLILALMLSACGNKAAPASNADAAAEAAPEPEPVPEPMPEPAPPAGPVSNVDFNVTITYADGSSKNGNVIRIERASDLYGEESWLGDEGKIKVNAEGNNTYKKLPWDQIQTITIKPGTIPRDVSCTYSSSYMPWMYECSIRNTPTMSDREGNQWLADTGQKWRFFFVDGAEVEFWLKNHYARVQDDTEPSLDTEMMERPELYAGLNTQLAEEVRSSMVVSIRLE